MTLLTREEVVRHLGAVSDHTVVEVLRINPDQDDLENVAMRLAQENDVMGEARKPLSGIAAGIYDIVMRDPLYADEEREGKQSSS